MTNAEKIRSLNDDQLALFLYFAIFICKNSELSIGQWLKWLKEEAKDEAV